MEPTTDYDLTTSGTARELSKSEQTVRDYDRKGLLKAIRSSNGHRLFSRTAVQALKAAMATTAEPSSR